MSDKSVDYQPTFQAEKVTGTFHRTVIHIEEDVRMVGPNRDKSLITRKLMPKDEVFTEGYMIYFPQAHSIFVAADDIEQLQRIGVLEKAPIIDMVSGEVVPDGFKLSPKERVELKQKNRPRPMGSTGGMTALEQGVIE